jgi:histidinol-phosphate aminotransferase
MTLSTDLAVLQGQPDYVKTMKPYLPGKPIEELKQEYGFEKIIKLASNENPFGSSPKALQAIGENLESSFRYPDPISRRLRHKMALRLNINPDELVVTAGGESLICHLIRAFLKPGDEGISPEGAFMGLDIHLAAHGGILRKVPSPHYRFDVEGILKALTPKTRLVYLPNPNNPTGSYLNTAELQQLIAGIPQDVLLFIDEAYYEFARETADYPDTLSLRQDNILILRTFSKAFGLGGLRIGYGIGHPQVIEQIAKIKLTFEPSYTAQIAAEAAWDDIDFLEKTVSNNHRERTRLLPQLQAIGVSCFPSLGNFILMEFKSEETVQAINMALLQQGIAIRPLKAFGYPHCARVSIGLPEENDTFVKALSRIIASNSS